MKKFTLLIFFTFNYLNAMEIKAPKPLEALYKSINHLKRIEEDLAQCSKIVDFGCREGEIAAYLARRYPQSSIIGIDFSEQLVEKAKKKHQLPNLSFYEINKFSREDKREELDLIIFLGELHWFKNQKSYLETVVKCLKADGRILLSTAAPIKNNEELILMHGQLHYQERRGGFRLFYPINACALKVLTEKVGLAWINASIIEKKFTFNSEMVDQLSKAIASQLRKESEGTMEEEEEKKEIIKVTLISLNNTICIPQLIFYGKKI